MCGFLNSFSLVLVVLCVTQTVVAEIEKWGILYSSLEEPIHMHDQRVVNFTLQSPDSSKEHHFKIFSENSHVAEANKTIWLKAENYTKGRFSGNFSVTGNFLGQTRIFFVVKDAATSDKHLDEHMNVVVIRQERVIDTVFTVSVAILASIIYINFGCALKWSEFRATLVNPTGPILGFLSQFTFMPIMSYLLGVLLFPDQPDMQLGLFFTGVSPAGGASNIWTLLLNGNVDLSITMTTISTFAAFGMMPLWIFTLGRVIFSRGNLAVPYTKILTYAIALIIPLSIGFLLQRYLQNVARFLIKTLKMFATLMTLFIVTFAIVTNLYLFELFSWQIIVAGIVLPWSGYIFGYTFAGIFKQNAPDRLAIAIETGVQNTGIAIFLLRTTLPQPQADLTTIAPVSIAMMTPFPLLVMYIWKKISTRFTKTLEIYDVESDYNAKTGDITPLKMRKNQDL